jgi:hypothetical protein
VPAAPCFVRSRLQWSSLFEKRGRGFGVSVSPGKLAWGTSGPATVDPRSPCGSCTIDSAPERRATCAATSRSAAAANRPNGLWTAGAREEKVVARGSDGREPFERVGARQTLARQTAPTALAPVYHLTAWSFPLEPLEPAVSGAHCTGTAASTTHLTCLWIGIELLRTSTGGACSDGGGSASKGFSSS